MKKTREYVDALKAHGFTCKVVTGGGSGTYQLEAGSGVFSEIQPGPNVVFAHGMCSWFSSRRAVLPKISCLSSKS